jgi:hypothetical protein
MHQSITKIFNIKTEAVMKKFTSYYMSMCLISLSFLPIHSMKLEYKNESVYSLLSLFIDILSNITHESLVARIKMYMRLSVTCSHFNTLLTPDIIGTLCKQYTEQDKLETFKNLIIQQYTTQELSNSDPLYHLIHRREIIEINKDLYNYPHIKIPALILARADTHLAKTWLLQAAAHKKNKELIKAVFENENPNDIVRHAGYRYPAFFRAETPEIAQTFAECGVDLTRNDTNGYNVLWYLGIYSFRSLNLMEFYIEHKVNVHAVCPESGNCLLHHFIKHRNNLDKIEFLIKLMPEMINAHNKSGQTPLDFIVVNNSYLELNEPYIVLLRKHGGLTAKEYAQYITSIKQKRESDITRFDCIIS